MSFAQLQEEIFTQAKQAAEALRTQQQQVLTREEKRIQKQAREIEETMIDQAKREGRARAQRIHQAAQLEAKASILSAKQMALTDIQQEVVKNILSWETGKAEKLIKALLKLVPDKTGVITPGSAHAVIVRQVAHKDWRIADEEIQNDGGFIWRGKKNELNATITHLVGELFSRQRTELAKALF